MMNQVFLPRRTLLLAALGALLPSAAFALDGKALLDKFLSEVSGAEGAFRQETRDRTGKVTNAAEGTFAFLRPGAFDWVYEKPWRQRIVSDGKTIWVYDEDLMQVTVRQAGDALSQTPAALLFGAGKLPDGWREMSAGDLITLTPDEPQGGFERVEVKFAGSGLPDLLRLHDSFGQTTPIVFTRFEKALPDAARFLFKVPQGVEVLQSP